MLKCILKEIQLNFLFLIKKDKSLSFEHNARLHDTRHNDTWLNDAQHKHPAFNGFLVKNHKIGMKLRFYSDAALKVGKI
jgi:hypothetical protein